MDIKKEKNISITIPEGFDSLPKPFQDFIYQLLKKFEQLEEENRILRAENKALKEENAELRHRLSKSSSNSNKPPSTDQYGRKPRLQNNREKSGKKPGGQHGHPGSTLQPVEKPDIIEIYNVNKCSSCQYDLSEVQAAGYISRQECDIPPVKPVITEHRMSSTTCPKCKAKNVAASPRELTQSIQYGPRIKILAAYFHYEQLIPLQRVKHFFSDVFSLSMSEGTLVNMFEEFHGRLEGFSAEIKANLQQSPVNHYDETGIYINGKTQWLHSASNGTSTAFFIHQKRGSEAMNALNILPHYKGIAVHDHWSPYFKYELAQHSLCNAHHLRELRGIFENYEQPWAQHMLELLLTINKEVNEHKEAGISELSVGLITKFSEDYDSILDKALSQIPHIKPSKQPKKRGRIKQHPAKNLFDRLTKRKPETLRFMYDFRVPFTNNQAERDIRMVKVKQKISGCFRSNQGADRFSRIRGCISTLKKQGKNVFQALENITRAGP